MEKEPYFYKYIKLSFVLIMFQVILDPTLNAFHGLMSATSLPKIMDNIKLLFFFRLCTF